VCFLDWGWKFVAEVTVCFICYFQVVFMELTGYSDNLWQCLSCMCVCVDWQASTQTVPDGRWVLHRCCTGNDADQTGTALCGTDSGPAQAECMFLMQCFTRWTSYLCKRRKLSDYIRFSVVLCVSRICEKSSGWFHEIWLRALPWCMEQSHFGVVLQKLVVLSYFVCVSTSRAETTEDVWMMLVSFFKACWVTLQYKILALYK